MNQHALGVLEYHRVLDLAAARASSAPGASLVRSLSPSTDLTALESEHARISAMRAVIESDEGWTPHPLPNVDRALERLRLVDAPLVAEDFVGLGTVLRSGRLTRDALGSAELPPMAAALFGGLRDGLLADQRAESAIEHVVDEEGAVRDGASPVLRRVRRELRSAEGDLVALLEKTVQQLEARFRVPDVSVTVRNGRYVIPIRREARSVVGGLVHDTSSTGSTLFVEPPAAIEACNQIRELEAEEAREVDRLLSELTEQVRPLHAALRASFDALTILDSLYARARFAIDFRCGSVRLLVPGSGFSMAGARHPLLVEQGIEVVPFDLTMEPGEHTLLVSGPNTGGKTVLLKTLGLLSMMAQAGLPVPVAAGSSIVVFDDVFADVGDEQSIEASLSTFSAHLRNIAEILRLATGSSLVLLDELGSGTDPLEGAALGGAVLESLTKRGATTVATTHLGALKELAGEVGGVVNASLQFDAEALAPTFLLVKGIPGRSYGISIARRLGLPDDVLRRADARVPQVERDVNALLESLERRDAEMARREAELEEARESTRADAYRLAEREGRLREREREFERESRRETRRYLLEARAEVERTIRELKRLAADAADDAARMARQRVEQMAEAQRSRLDELDAADAPVSTHDGALASEASAGDLVHVGPLGGRLGRLLELRGDECIVAIGSVKMTFPRAAVSRAAVQSLVSEVPVRGDLPEVQAATEIDVRGMRAGELDEVVLQALDAAIRAELPSLRIIHGKGSGALRERVAEMLKKDTRVRGFRIGAWNEGGSGVTVAEL